MTQETNVAPLPVTQDRPKRKLLEKFADRYSVDASKLMGTLKATCFKAKDRPATDEEMMALLIVADQYGLNPFTKEIFAFPDKQNGIVPVVGVDGWSRIINDHKALNGFEFRYADELTTPADGQECPKWCEVVIYRKDREHPTVVREYLDEVYRKPFKAGMKGPWQTHTKRFLRHKTLIQGARLAFGFSGIYDEDEAQGMIDITPRPADAPPRPQLTDFEQQPTTDTVELLPLIDEFGESMGEFSKPNYVKETVKKVEALSTRDMLDAFMDHNVDVQEGLGTRSDERKDIARAFNDACANLSAKEDAPTQAPNEPDGGWEAWCDNASSNINTMPDKASLNKWMANKKAELEDLKAALPEQHQDIINRVNARDAELNQPKDQE